MKITDLYEIIRREGVCLFVGSACSTYANYPNVEKLKIILNNSLSESNHVELNFNQNLMDFTEDYVASRDRNELTKKLQEIYLAPPSSTTFHDNLAKIPHFQTIITTNYDKLLEESFKGAIVVTKDSDISRIREGDTVIYKIHGDIEDGSSIVITRSDYVSIQKRDFKNPFWASIVHEISKKNVLFFGYGYEDDNVRADFEYVYEKLGSSKKQRFMIGRSANDLKLKKLKQRGVNFIICEADDFVTGFIKHLKEHIVADAKRKWISADAAQKFIHSFDKRTVVHKSSNGLDAIYITRPDGASNHTVEIQATDPSIIEGLQGFNKTYDIKELTIKREHLKAFTHMVEGFLVSDLEEFLELKLMILPTASGICTIEFPEHSDFELHGVKFQVLSHIDKKIRISAEVYGFKIIIDILRIDDRFNFNFTIKEPEVPVKIKHCCQVFQAIIWILSGEPFQSTTDTGSSREHRFDAAPDLQEFSKALELYKMLSQIEKFFRINLPEVRMSNISAEDQNLIWNLSSILTNRCSFVRDINAQLRIDLPGDPEIMDKILHGIPKDTYLILERGITKKINLLGIELDLGTEQISILEPTVRSFNKKKRSAVLIPKDFTIVTRYSKIGLLDMHPKKVLWALNREI